MNKNIKTGKHSKHFYKKYFLEFVAQTTKDADNNDN